MNGAIVIFRDRDGHLPTGGEMKQAGFAVSSAVTGIGQKKRNGKRKKRNRFACDHEIRPQAKR